MSRPEVTRKLAAVMSADIAGYSRLMGADEEGTLTVMRAVFADIVEPSVDAHQGRVFKNTGDGFLAEFASVVETVRCALEIQEFVQKANADLTPETRIEFRIGINLGDVMVEGGDVYGDGVNVAARLQELASPGGICLSGGARDQVQDRFGFAFEDRGEVRLKNIRRPIRFYDVSPVSDLSYERKQHGHPARQILRTSRWVSALIVIVAAISGVFWWLSDLSGLKLAWPGKGQDIDISLRGERPEFAKASIAVLPFENLSADPSQEYFADGITEDIITALSRIRNLAVIARNSTFVYKDRAVNVQDVGREFGVRYVLEGSVRRVDERVRISAQLIETESGSHLWAERFDREATDVFSVQDEVTRSIVSALHIEVPAAELERAKRKDTRVMQAYDYVLRGRELSLQFSPGTQELAKEMFRQAIGLDPNYAQAYSYLAVAYLNDWRLAWGAKDALERAVQFARQAIEIDSGAALAHAVLAETLLWRREFDQAVAEIELALELNPNNPFYSLTHGDILTWMGRPDEALPHLQQAIRLNPNFPYIFLWTLGHAYFVGGRYQDAVNTFERLRGRNPDFWPAWLYLAAAYAYLGREEEAQLMADTAYARNPNLSLEDSRKNVPYRRPEDVERLFDGLTRAGMPPN